MPALRAVALATAHMASMCLPLVARQPEDCDWVDGLWEEDGPQAKTPDAISN